MPIFPYSFWENEFCLATIEAMCFSVRSFGCALFYFLRRKAMEENLLATSPQNQITSKEIMSEFVMGAVEMETQIYTLEETIKKH